MIGFERAVPANGYAWWYVDALSDDGAHGLTLIAFIGSVFSPYYAWSRRHGPVDPLNHCAINVALYGPSVSAWSMTERPAASVLRSPTRFTVGPSSMQWKNGTLEIDIDEWTAPWPLRLQGRVRLHCESLLDREYALDDGGRHRWRPLAPRARVDVDMEWPGLRWSGTGYLDSNRGSEPLEQGIIGWDWSRAHTNDGSTAIVYDIERAAGGRKTIALLIEPGGEVRDFEPPAPCRLARSRWGLKRIARTTAPTTAARIVRSFEDGPFYSRAVVATEWMNQEVETVHETVSLARFSRRWVQCLLPFRMPRAAANGQRPAGTQYDRPSASAAIDRGPGDR